MVLSDKLILQRILEGDMLEDAILHQLEEGVISSGVSCAGYDLVLDYNIKVTRQFDHVVPRICSKDHIPPYVLDPKNPDANLFTDLKLEEGMAFILAPGEYFIGNSVETFNMPDDIIGVVLGKSTYARNQIFINCTPIEPGWCGSLAIEGGNTGTLPTVIYPGEGICQVLFFRVDGEVLRTYDKRKGKYQNQGKNDLLSKVR